MSFKLTRDITADELAMVIPGDDGYAPSDVIGPAGTDVLIVQADINDPCIEVTGFANDPFATGWINRNDLEEEV